MPLHEGAQSRLVPAAEVVLQQLPIGQSRSVPQEHCPAKELDDLARAGVVVGKGATVVVKNDSKSVKTMVKNDETGTYVIVATPNKRLTAHDKDGKLLFDGDIETPEQQQKVPGEVWEKVKPMLEQMGPVNAEQPEAENGEQGKSTL